MKYKEVVGEEREKRRERESVEERIGKKERRRGKEKKNNLEGLKREGLEATICRLNELEWTRFKKLGCGRVIIIL